MALPRSNGQLDAGHAGNLRRARAGRVHDPVGIDHRSVRQADAGQRCAVALEPDDLADALFDAERAGLAPEPLEQRVGVEPALVGKPERGAGQVIGVEPVEARVELGRGEELNRHIERALDRMIVLQRRQAGLGRQEQVAVLDEVDLRHLAVDREISVRVLDQVESEPADLDVERGAELQPDACRRERGRAGPERRISLDHHDPAVEVRARRQEGRHRGADDGAAHDHHVGVISVLHPPDASR